MKAEIAENKEEESQSSSGSGDEEDNVADLPISAGVARKGPRMSVSAEVFGKFNKQQDYKAPVFAKSEEAIKAIRERMSKNFIFESLNPMDKKSVVDAIVAKKYNAGDVIIKEGDDGDNFYLVESGELDCTKRLKKEDTEDTFLKTYVQGESFGELALLYNAPRAATITCKSATCELWSLDRNTFTYIIKTAVQKKREKYDDFLENVEILKCLSHPEKLRMADALREEWFDKDDVIIQEGDQAGDRFYMIIEGECIATKVLEPGKAAQTVKNYAPGSYFGERSLLKDLPRAASIIATSQVQVVSLDRAAFKRLMGPLEDILGRNEDEYNKFM